MAENLTLKRYSIVLLRNDHLERFQKLIERDIKHRQIVSANAGYDNTESKRASERNIIPLVLSEYISALDIQQLSQCLDSLKSQYNEILRLGTLALQTKLANQQLQSK